MPPSINDLIADEALRHSVSLQQYSNSVVQRIMKLLNRSDDRLYAELVIALQGIDPTSFSVERLESLLYSVRAVNAEAYRVAGKELTDELRQYVQYEAAYQRQALASMLPVSVRVAAVSPEVAYTAALSRPFMGVLLRGALADLEAGKAKKIRQVVAQGFTESKTTDQIIRELRGTRAKGFADGSMEAPRRDIEAITRTALGHMAGFTQDRFVEANTDLIKAVRFSATLDLRVTKAICLPRDGKLYTPVDHKPIGHNFPWLGGPGRMHYRCRSHQSYVLFSHKELGIDAPEVTVMGGQRASMDGALPKEVTYFDWISKQSAVRQDDVLGPKRGALLRNGGLKIEDMYGSKGQFLSLSDLRKQDAKAFEKAGL